ncbi:MAG: hypothetical protein IKD26_02630 [Clostridia bacterium]|nr:hypothetical protein [Clostridia bacterium]
MYYCEDCNIKNPTNRCNRCGAKNLREIRDDDYCFFGEMEATAAENLKNKLQSEGIGCALIPSGTGIRSLFALKLENCLVFIEYRAHDYVADLFAQEALRKTELLKEEVVPNLDKLYALPNDEKKIRKRIKLHKTENLIELCKNVILSATKGADLGPIVGDEVERESFSLDDQNNFRYYYFANEQYEVWINAYTMRIYKANKTK